MGSINVLDDETLGSEAKKMKARYHYLQGKANSLSCGGSGDIGQAKSAPNIPSASNGITFSASRL